MTVATVTGAEVIVDSVDMATTAFEVHVVRGGERMGAVEAIVVDSEEAIVAVARMGRTELVDVTEAIGAADVMVAEETVVVLMIGWTTCGDVVRINTAATGA